VTARDRSARTLAAAVQVARLLDERGVAHALIGSVALAVHGYVRATRDVDLGVLVPPAPRLAELAAGLRQVGLSTEVSSPAPDDELGGVITVTGDGFDPVQIVNFWNPPRPGPALVREALATATRAPGFPLPVVDLPHLVALKLSTGARRDELDVLALLEARPDADRDALRAVCTRHGLGEAIARALAEGPGA
jgi:hypothetical protein